VRVINSDDAHAVPELDLPILSAHIACLIQSTQEANVQMIAYAQRSAFAALPASQLRRI
jgi:hypothetical protein